MCGNFLGRVKSIPRDEEFAVKLDRLCHRKVDQDSITPLRFTEAGLWPLTSCPAIYECACLIYESKFFFIESKFDVSSGVDDNMNIEMSALVEKRKAEASTRAVATSASVSTPEGTTNDPEVRINGEHLASSIPVVQVDSGESSKAKETAKLMGTRSLWSRSNDPMTP